MQNKLIFFYQLCLLHLLNLIHLLLSTVRPEEYSRSTLNILCIDVPVWSGDLSELAWETRTGSWMIYALVHLFWWRSSSSCRADFEAQCVCWHAVDEHTLCHGRQAWQQEQISKRKNGTRNRRKPWQNPASAKVHWSPLTHNSMNSWCWKPDRQTDAVGHCPPCNFYFGP